jgi:hypothetical protein
LSFQGRRRRRLWIEKLGSAPDCAHWRRRPAPHSTTAKPKLSPNPFQRLDQG